MGVTVEFTDDENFIDIYYTQLISVFKKDGLVPTYSIDRVRQLWNHLKPANRLLTSWAKINNEIIATRIDVRGNNWLRSFGSASRQDTLHYCPNELLRYFVMSWAGQYGLRYYDMVGGGTYKAKFNAKLTNHVRLMRSTFLLKLGRLIAKKVIYWKNEFLSDVTVLQLLLSLVITQCDEIGLI
jgi:hypothetical protein